ncbi:flagellar hook-associated protein 3 [bacterium BMS3Abin06]|nr:flagellar hook-associated protein 3 [bacterium BMS3Abin06]
MLYNQFTSSLSKNLSKLGKSQVQLSSGKRLTKPSDDVIAARGAMAYKVSINEIKQFNRNIDEGLSMLGLTEIQLSASLNILNRARELAVAESNDTATAETREMTSYEMQNLFSELISIGNTKLKNRYIFSGYLSSSQAFNASGVYQGDTNNLEVYISDGIKTGINITGDTAFTDSTKQLSSVLGGTAGMGTLRITSGSGNPVTLPIKDTLTNASPQEVRDAINAPMSGLYNAADTIGTGTLTLTAGTGSPVTLTVDAANNTPALLRDAVNALDMGIEARLATDTVTNEVRLFFRPTTAGETFEIEVSGDGDGEDTDSNGLSALLHTGLQSNLTTTALGIEAFVINDTAGKRLLFAPTTPNTSYTIEVDEDGNSSFSDAGDTDTSGLSRIASGNLTGSINFFMIIDHMKNSLSSNDTAGIQGSIFLLDGALDSNINTTADVGSRLKYLLDQKDRLEDNEISYIENLSILEDADIAEVALEITKIESTLEAMRISSLKSLSQSLFDFLA